MQRKFASNLINTSKPDGQGIRSTTSLGALIVSPWSQPKAFLKQGGGRCYPGEVAQNHRGSLPMRLSALVNQACDPAHSRSYASISGGAMAAE
jgi:hypothetical protein